MKKPITLIYATLFGTAGVFLAIPPASAEIVGPVNVLETRNDGTLPAACTGDVGSTPGGVAEMALDLDQDGVVDACFGSYTANSCPDGFNFDAITFNGTLLSTQDSIFNSIMGGTDASMATWEGQEVGPNFQVSSGSTSSANIGIIGEPMVFGFRGGSNTPDTEVGYFSFTVNEDCSIDFGSVDYKTGSNTFSRSVQAGAKPPVSAQSIPTMPVFISLATIGFMALMGFAGIRRKAA